MNLEPDGIILTFPTTRGLLAAERCLAEEGWAIETIPVPTGIASDCGFCVRRSSGARCRAGNAGEAFMDRAAGLDCEGIWLETTLADTENGREERRYERYR